MSESATDIIQKAIRQTDVFALVSAWTTLKKVGNEYHGPCPICGGTDRFHVNPRRNFCGCRKCDHRWDAVGIYALKFGIRPIEAAKEILGISDSPKREAVKLEPAQKVQEDVRSETWQDEALSAISKGIEALASEKGQEGREYLASRCITAKTYERYSIGFDLSKFNPSEVKSRPALVIPWMSEDEVYAIKYRFIKGDGKLRYMSKSGSVPRVFGAQNLRSNDVLIVIEGEINALSVAQLTAYDVLSIGSQGNEEGLNLAVQIAESRGYDRVITWFDEFPVSKATASRFTTQEVIPMFSRLKRDANDILSVFGPSTLKDLLDEAFRRDPSVCPVCLGKRYEVVRSGLHRTCSECSRGGK